MAKKFGKVVLLGLIAGATAAGVYHFLKSQNSGTKEFDDFDDFDELDNFDFDEDVEDVAREERKYVSLDSAKAIAGTALGKAKEAISNLKEKFQESVADDEDMVEDFDLDDFSEEKIDENTEEKSEEKSEEVVEEITTDTTEDVTNTASATTEESDSDYISDDASVEEFFDDDEE